MTRNRFYKTDSIDNYQRLRKHHSHVDDQTRQAGDISGKIPVRIDATTVVCVDEGADVEYIRQKYLNMMGKL